MSTTPTAAPAVKDPLDRIAALETLIHEALAGNRRDHRRLTQYKEELEAMRAALSGQAKGINADG